MTFPITEETLKTAEYEKWIDINNSSSSYLSSWQKKVHGKYGLHYFINIKLQDYDKEFPHLKWGKRWEAASQMITLDAIDDGDVFDISLSFRPQMTLDHLEHFFANTWENMNARAYEYFSGNEETHIRERQAKMAAKLEQTLRVAIKSKL